MGKTITLTVTLNLIDATYPSTNGITEICENISNALVYSDNVSIIAKNIEVKCSESPKSGEYFKEI
jgi:hypothetical protein